MASPFVPNYSPPITYEFALALAHSALVSLALLTADMDVQDDEEWVSVTAAALSPEQAQRNRLVFGPFGAALAPARDFPDFPAYLAALGPLLAFGKTAPNEPRSQGQLVPWLKAISCTAWLLFCAFFLYSGLAGEA